MEQLIKAFYSSIGPIYYSNVERLKALSVVCMYQKGER